MKYNIADIQQQCIALAAQGVCAGSEQHVLYGTRKHKTAFEENRPGVVVVVVVAWGSHSCCRLHTTMIQPGSCMCIQVYTQEWRMMGGKSWTLLCIRTIFRGWGTNIYAYAYGTEEIPTTLELGTRQSVLMCRLSQCWLHNVNCTQSFAHTGAGDTH